MTKKEKELFIKRKIGFNYSQTFGYFRVEAIIKDVTSIGFIIEVTESRDTKMYEIGYEYFIPFNTLVYKFL